MKRAVEFLLLLTVLAFFIYVSRGKLEAYFYNRGNDYYGKRLYSEALGSYKNALKVNPQSWRSHLGLAETYRDMQDYDMAAEEYNSVLRINPLSDKTYRSLAEMYSQAGRHSEALEAVSRSRERFPDSEEIKSLTKDCCHAFVISTLNKGTEFFLEGDVPGAIRLLKEALRLCPDFAIAQYTLGYYYFFSKDYANAESSLHKAILLDPKLHYAYKLLSQIYFKTGKFEKELSSAREAFALDKDDAAACNDLGLALMHLERYGEAIAYLKRAVSLDPDNPDYIYSLGSLYRDNKMFDQAIAEYNKLSVIKSDYPNLHNDMADIYENLGNRAQAVSEYRKEARYCQQGLKSDPGNPILLNNYAYALNGLDQPEEAKKIAESLIRSHPNYRQGYLTFSKINEKMHDTAAALKSLEKAKGLSSGEEFIEKEIFRLHERPVSKAAVVNSGQKDVIYLKSGRKLEGKILKDDPDKIVLEIRLGGSSGEVVFYRDLIERVEKAE
jgi:tetratricopeptide (TPR) repeat protein